MEKIACYLWKAPYVVTNNLALTEYEDLSAYSKQRWIIEEFHRGIQQTTGIERCCSIKKRSQLTHIFACLPAGVFCCIREA